MTAKIIKVSNSMLVSVANCSTLAMIKTAGWSVPNEDEKAMVAGSAAHVALEWWLQGSSPATCVEAFRANYEPFSNLYVTSDNAYHVDNLARIIEYYVQSHPIDEMPFEVICTEREIEAELLPAISDSCPAVGLVIRADGLVVDKESEALQPMEHKTHGRAIYPDWKKGFSMDPQIMTHLFGWRTEGYTIDSVLMNAIPFVKLPPSRFTTDKKTGEAKEASCRTRDHAGMKPSQCWTLHCQGQFFSATPSEYAYEKWLVEARVAAAKYRRLLMQPSEAAIPMEGLSHGYCRRCSFNDFCYSGRGSYESLTKKEAPLWITRSGLYDE